MAKTVWTVTLPSSVCHVRRTSACRRQALNRAGGGDVDWKVQERQHLLGLAMDPHAGTLRVADYVDSRIQDQVAPGRGQERLGLLATGSRTAFTYASGLKCLGRDCLGGVCRVQPHTELDHGHDAQNQQRRHERHLGRC
ncbi:hypothetical protein ABH920_002626 [Catenulispora sp. EB89]